MVFDRKAWMREYHKSIKYQAYEKKRRQLLEYKICMKKYKQTPTGKLVIMEVITRRKRNLGFIPIMNNPFPQEIKVDYHHINKMFVIPTPRKLHRSTSGKQHRIKVNKTIENLGFNLGVFTK